MLKYSTALFMLEPYYIIIYYTVHHLHMQDLSSCVIYIIILIKSHCFTYYTHSLKMQSVF